MSAPTLDSPTLDAPTARDVTVSLAIDVTITTTADTDEVATGIADAVGERLATMGRDDWGPLGAHIVPSPLAHVHI